MTKHAGFALTVLFLFLTSCGGPTGGGFELDPIAAELERDLDPPSYPGDSCDDDNGVNGDGCSDGGEVELGWACYGAPSICRTLCGDGLVRGSEQCDDGNDDERDGCKSDCTPEEMGDGLHASGACDDSNLSDGDGCDSSGAIEMGWDCFGEPSVCMPVCGDGLRSGDEACDDGNQLNHDGCHEDCSLELMGDGYLEWGIVDGCDDGNLEDGDGCSGAGFEEPGWDCFGEPSVCRTQCGDGLLRGAEQCDDGNTHDYDGCREDCTLDVVGDGHLPGHWMMDICDDGNLEDGDGCSAEGFIEEGWACWAEPSICVPMQPYPYPDPVDGCGDGLIAETEECDDGNIYNQDGCSDHCLVEPCGDGKVNWAGYEQCDDGNLVDGDGCSSQCMQEAGWACALDPSVCGTGCGDGLVRGNEQCDDGNWESRDGCSSDCEVELCGDGRVSYNGPEQCDDGNLISGDGCSASCQIETGFECQLEPSVCAGRCGDGLVTGAEQCDDGNLQSRDGCAADCRVERCGDGRISYDGAEQCDDGNHVSGDGCSASCQLETGWECQLEPSVCDTLCGDNLVRGDEACDDGAPRSGDGCSASCQVEPCGDGRVARFTERCDDGNRSDGDGCSGWCGVESGWSCELEPSVCLAVCGDGLVRGDEACDDGNLEAGDGCAPDCSLEPEPVASQQPWREHGLAPRSTGIAWDYAMGFHFTPLRDGEVTELGGFFEGVKTVRLFERASGALLAETQVEAHNDWGYAEIDPVAVEAGVGYTVAVYLAGSGGSYVYGDLSLPSELGDVRIDATTYVHTGSAPDARPIHALTNVMYGQADISFVPSEVLPDLRLSQLPWQSAADGDLRTDVAWDYAMGYHFTPLVDGKVLALGGFFSGIKEVKLFDRETGGLLAATTASASNDWGYADIEPVDVIAGRGYTVAVYLAGSGGSYRTGVATFPRTIDDIRIEGTTYIHTGNDAAARPTVMRAAYMFGQADLEFRPN